MLTKNCFTILYNIYRHGYTSQRTIAANEKLSLGTVNKVLAELKENGFVSENRLTEKGKKALEPYRVKNAVIMAAGLSTRFAPLSYENPKALLKVKGEILIERQIEQLIASGITDITLVVGYMKEKLFYLEEKYGVKIVINEDYYKYNNTSTLMRVANILDNTYICSSDNYFTENVFEPFVYHSFYSAVYSQGKTDEYCLKFNSDGLITNVTIGGENCWYMLGHVYFSREFSAKFSQILACEYENALTKDSLWEDMYMRYTKVLPLYVKQYPASVIREFDSLDELRCFDEMYVTNADSEILNNIAATLNLKQSDISQIIPIKTGLTNTSFSFTAKNKKYVYRHPGAGTQAYINRRSEAESLKIAAELGLDDTFIYIEPDEGWKISHYVDEAEELDYHNDEHIEKALQMMRTLHDKKIKTDYRFDVWGQLKNFEEILKQHDRFSDDTKKAGELIWQLKDELDKEKCEEILCHCDCYSPNFLVDKFGKMFLIDWEYSGMADPGCDIGTFIACSDYTEEEAYDLISRYYGRKPSVEELRHMVAYVSVEAYYWYLWALYQEVQGKNVGEYLFIWYKYTKTYAKLAAELYGLI